MSNPVHCRPEAFRLLAAQLPHLETTAGLLRGAVAIAGHELDGVDPGQIATRLNALADRVLARVRSRSPRVVMAHLHQVLFEDEGYTGNLDDYYNPANSYLPRVLETHLGIPITLTLIYKVVAERIGLDVEGINAPGHFLARVQTDDGSMLIDAYSGGRLVTDTEALQRIEEVTGRPFVGLKSPLQRATHRQWLARMIANLHNIFVSQNRREDVEAMVELQSLLGPARK